MNLFEAIVLGIVQGLAELLPISSSAHLNLIPWIFNWTSSEDFNIAFEAFDVALHVGTLLAIAIFFFKDWLELLIGGYNQVIKKKKTFEGKMFWYIVAATIPGGIIGFLLDHFLEDALTKPLIIAIALIIMGIILYIADEKCPSKIDYEHLSFKQTFIIGVSQSLAFIPGVSRSGVTMTVARILGVDRESAAKYSFMLSAPIVAGAALYKLKDFVFSFNFFAGVLASFIVGILVIKFLLEYLKKGSFKAFAIYRVILGVFVIALCIIR